MPWSTVTHECFAVVSTIAGTVGSAHPPNERIAPPRAGFFIACWIAAKLKLAIAAGIINANAQYLGGSRKTSKRILTKRFLEQFICACSYLKTQDYEKDMQPLEVMGKEFHRTMSVWVWLRPDIRAIVHLAGLYNNEPDALAALELDKERRQEKAKIIKAFRACIDEFIERAAYMTGSGEGSNDHLQGIFNIASRGLLLAREAMEWEEDD